MTRATLIIHDEKSNSDIEAKFVIEEESDRATVTLTETEVQINTQKQPTVTSGVLTQTGPIAGNGPVGLKSVLEGLDPRDSESALQLYYWLVKYQRITKIGSLDGAGNLLFYQEPKGTTKEGYTPGVSVADQIVDAMVEKVGDQTPTKHGICSQCFSAVSQGADDAHPRKDDVEDESAYICSGSDTPHVMA
jgi:hypothetical protein